MLTVDDALIIEMHRAVVAAPKEIRSQIRSRVTELRPAWRAAVSDEVGNSPHPKWASRLIAAPTRVQVSDNRIRTHVSASRPALSGGMNPRDNARQVEFGSNGNKRKSYTSRRQGTTYRIDSRRVNAQLAPRRARGATFFEAGREMIPRAYSFWAQTVFRTIAEALEGKS